MNFVDSVYKLRRNFLIIGLTGRTGSGCTTVAHLLENGFEHIVPFKKSLKDNSNDDRKYIIETNFLQTIWKKKIYQFTILKASDIIFFYAMKENFEDFCKLFIEKEDKEKSTSNHSQSNEVNKICELKGKYNEYSKIVNEINKHLEEEDSEISYHKYNGIMGNKLETSRYLDFLLKDLPKFRDKVMKASGKSKGKITALFQEWGDNIRQYGKVTKGEEVKKPSHLAHTINRIITKLIYKKDVPTLVVIDSLRNPYEVLYFRERYSFFYLMSINIENSERVENLINDGFDKNEIIELDNKEYPSSDPSLGRKDIDEYYSQDVEKCVELSDIHIVHNNDKVEINTELMQQISHVVALILHPGLVPPTPEERLMQIAYTAKFNSGCISRQVGAVITDKDYSVKAIGWNTVAKGQTPCSLRNLCDLVRKRDLSAFSGFEKEDEAFREKVKEYWSKYCEVPEDDTSSRLEKLEGIPLAYCFKDYYTVLNKGNKNQVHTRSLHAEENAFLQLAKYGSMGIEGGYLFTTASCCELCAKKAYQLGISKIYYIDIYPGISNSHILNAGSHTIETKLFQGVIGRAYEALYSPFFPMKDEIEYLTGVEVKYKDLKDVKDVYDDTSSGDASNNVVKDKCTFIQKIFIKLKKS